MLGAYPLATTPLATLPTTGAVAATSLWINTRLDLTGAAESGIVQSMFGAGAVSLFGHAPAPLLVDSVQDATIAQPTAAALVPPVHQSYSDATIVIDPSGDALATPVVGNFSTSIYEYEPYYEDHYIQTNGSPDYMWAPSGADGVENATGTYTLFVKVLQMDPRSTDYWRFLNLYDDNATSERQTTDYIAQLFGATDRVLFGGNRSTGGLNYQFQPAATSASDQGIQVFSTRVNLTTNRLRSRISAGGSTLYESADFAFVEDRDPLHICINTFMRVISGVHTPQGQYAKFKFIAAGLISAEATSAKLASYSVTGDARRIWGTDLFAYWTATSMYDSASPKLRNLVDASKPMYLNSLGFADRALVPYGNIAAVSGSVLNTTRESTQTPIDADVLVEITVTQVDLFIEAHMPLSTEGDGLLGISDNASAYSEVLSVQNSLVTGQDNAGLFQTLVPIDEDAVADISNSGWLASSTPVDVDAPVALGYTATADTTIVTDSDALFAPEHSLVADTRARATASASNGVLVSTDEHYAIDTFDADVEVIVNVTTTDLDIEAKLPTVTDDVFFVGQLNAARSAVEAPITPELTSGSDTSTSASSASTLVPVALQNITNEMNEAAAYEYEGGLEQHYLQTYNNNFLWSPMAAAGIESATGKYTLFVKILQTHLAGAFPYLPGGFFASLYDNSADGSQTVAAVRASASQEDTIVFYGVTDAGGSNFDYSTDTAWNTTELVAALVIDQTTTSAEYISYNKLYATLERHIEYIGQARSPLHFCLNARGRNFGAYHAGAGNFSQMKIIAAGLVADTVTEQQIIDYGNAKDARPIFGDSLYSYWVASLIDHDPNVDPTLQMPNLVDNTKPLLLNGSVYRANQYPLPKPNQFTAEMTIGNFLSSNVKDLLAFEATAFLSQLQELTSDVRVFVDNFTSLSIIYPPVSIYATAKLDIGPDTFLDAFANSPNVKLTGGVGYGLSLVSDGSADGPAAKVVVNFGGGIVATYVVRRR